MSGFDVLDNIFLKDLYALVYFMCGIVLSLKLIKISSFEFTYNLSVVNKDELL